MNSQIVKMFELFILEIFPDLDSEGGGEVVPGGLQLTAQPLHCHPLYGAAGGGGLLLLQPVQHHHALPGHLLQLHTELLVIISVSLRDLQSVKDHQDADLSSPVSHLLEVRLVVVLVEKAHESGELSGGLGGVDREYVHVLLNVEPLVHVEVVGPAQLTGEVLGVNVVEELRDVAHVEDIKVQEVVTVHQLSQHGSA